jgi:hypothetical protein
MSQIYFSFAHVHSHWSHIALALRALLPIHVLVGMERELGHSLGGFGPIKVVPVRGLCSTDNAGRHGEDKTNSVGFLCVPLRGFVAGKDGERQSIQADAISLFDAVYKAKQQWAMYWWFPPDALIEVRNGSDCWHVRQRTGSECWLPRVRQTARGILDEHAAAKTGVV